MTSNSLLSTKLLYRLNSKGHRNKTLLQKGFTLVELMVVIVIVGILSAVALPGFLSQAVKAKGTEAKSEISAIIKNGAAEYQFSGADHVDTLVSSGTCEGLGGKPDHIAGGDDPSTIDIEEAESVPQKFNYDCVVDADNNVLTVTATGSTLDTSLEGKTIVQAVNLDNGRVELQKDVTCTVFGGIKADGACAN